MRRPPLTAAGFVEWALRYGPILWVVACMLAVPAAFRTAWLYAHLRSDLEELLPRESQSVEALDELRRRIGERRYIGVVVDAGTTANVPHAEQLIDDLAARVRAYPPPLVVRVRTGREEERVFLDRHAPLYMEVRDLAAIRDRVQARRDYEVARETGALLDESAPAPPLDLGDIQSRYERELRAPELRKGSRFTSVEKHLSVLLLELTGTADTGNARALLERVRGDISALGGPERYAPGMRVGYAGDAVIAVEELSALVTDLSFSSVVVLVAVTAAIVFYYRWWRSILAVVPPLLLATVYAFAVSSLPPFSITALNSNTAFLGSIIVGNGINFGLILLARYVEERRRGATPRASLERAVAGSRGGTLAAAAAAGASYAALALTQFRGFRQFGFIGAFGMAFAWVLAFVLMPSLIARLDRDDSTRPRPMPERTRLSYWVSSAVSRAPALVVALTLAASLVAAVEVARFRASDIESDFSMLRRRDTWVSGEGYWGDRMNDVLGEYLTPFIFLADRPEDARLLADRLRARMGRPPLAGRVESVRTIDDVLPPLARQEARLEVIADIREALTPRVRAALASEQRDRLAPFLGDTLEPATLESLPSSFTLGLREKDGAVGKLVLVYPPLGAGWWNADSMRDFVASLRALARESVPPGARPPRLAGSIPLSSDILEAIRRDGPLASGAALAGVIAVVMSLLRWRRTTFYVLSSLCLGVLWLAGASQLFGIRINFANFIAFPITFGIGVDYAVNVMSRYEQDGSVDVLAAVRSTGAAVALCSLTTIIGYSSLLLAKNRALFLFGLLDVLGEIACLTAALVSLPAFLLLASRWRRGSPSPRRRSSSSSPSSPPAEPRRGATYTPT